MTIALCFSILALIATNFLWARYLRACDEAHAKQVDKLTDKIQAPEKAQIVEAPELGRQHIGLDEDAAYWAAREASEAAQVGIPD